MALIYGFIRSIVYALRKLAERRHARVKRVYEEQEESFSRLDGERKLEEVGTGRPVDYALQFRLLKSFEAKEQARQKWVAAAERMNRRLRLESKVQQFSGLRLPYTFGLIDMALVMKMLDELSSYGLPVLVTWCRTVMM
jgi:hypothetical protein